MCSLSINHLRLFLLLIIIPTGFLGCASIQTNGVKHFPNIPSYESHVRLTTQVKYYYIKQKITPKNNYTKEYNPFGKYLNYSITNTHRNNERVIFDDEGVPLVNYEGKFYSNAVTTSQVALAHYEYFLKSNQEKDKIFFLNITKKLISTQDDDGALRYPFAYKHYLENKPYKPGWISGMAQGQYLSVLARAYHLTGDNQYLIKGRKALRFLLTPIPDGGPMTTLEDLDSSLTQYVFFEEYITNPCSYTLNGFMFTLLGLYDWSKADPSTEYSNLASQYFNEGIRTLQNILPYYDINGFSAYDLGHLFHEKPPHLVPRYHAVHLYLLHALHLITSNPILAHFEKYWSASVTLNKMRF